MELGRLVTSESGGGIFYFIIDDVHPDEPRQDELKHYYVVAVPSSSTFSYREAYSVLCRAVCGLDNRTRLHRWHSLYEQIFGTTPYVQFVDAVRGSLLLDLDVDVAHTATTTANAAAAAAATAAADSGSPVPVSVAAVPSVALFSNETAARLALRQLLRSRLGRPVAQNGAHVGAQDAADSAAQQGCCTPTEARQPSPRGQKVADVQQPPQPLPLPVRTTANGVIRHGRGGGDTARDADANRVKSEKRLGDLVDLAARWRLGDAPPPPPPPSTATLAVQELQRQLHFERERRMDAEQHHHLLSRLLAERSNGDGVERAAVVGGAPPPAAPPPPSAATGGLGELRQQLQELQQELADERRRHARQRDELLRDSEQLKKQLTLQGREQSTRLEQFLKDNADAAARTEEALRKREEEVRSVYHRALQERDVRIAQLSQEVMQHTHESRHLALARSDEERLYLQRTAHLEEVAAQLRDWNASLQRQLSDSAAETRQLRQRLATVETRAVSDWRGPTACGEAPHTQAAQLAMQLYHTQQQLRDCQAELRTKSEELLRAAQLIDALKEGLRRVQIDLSLPSPDADADADGSGAAEATMLGRFSYQPPALSMQSVP
ncbi:hypothetical protein NESM_000499900 [Novymonas esmeraldas]|uniref:Uncharacterized protein n=1 Tax=Novymonas esmeraldas TaxID=1808958 RepID=A0AAW0EQG6_9TRYP